MSENLHFADNAKINFIHDDLAPYTRSYVREAALRGIVLNFPTEMVINMKKPSFLLRLQSVMGLPRTAAYCQFFGRRPVVMIYEDKWQNLSFAGREMLVFHELTHCFMRRLTHCDTTTVSGAPISLMATTLFDDKYYTEDRERLLDELFNPSPLCTQPATTEESYIMKEAEPHRCEH